MRRLAMLLCVACAACGARASGPAWPKSAGTERVGEAKDDGGESLAPKVAKEIAAVEASEDDVTPVAAATPAKPKPAEGGGGAAPAPVLPAADGDAPVMLDFEEEIVIDVQP